MNESEGVIAKIVGGPHDGEQFAMLPCPGVGPPHFMAFHASRRRGEAGTYVVDVYEAWPPVAAWPKQQETIEYHHQPRIRAMNEQASR